MDGGTDPGSKQLHLPVFIRTAVIKVEQLWASISGNRRFHDGHKVYEVVIEKQINPDDEPAGIIDEGKDEHFMFFAIRGTQVRADAGVTAPYFIDMGAFIAAHILSLG